MAEKVQTIQEVTAKIGDLHIAPRKVRLVVDLVKNKSAAAALEQLRFLKKKSARPLTKLINSAIANAQNNFKLEPQTLFIKAFTVDAGQVMRRFKPRAQGRAFPIRRRTSIVEVTLISRSGMRVKKASFKSRRPVPQAVEKIVAAPDEQQTGAKAVAKTRPTYDKSGSSKIKQKFVDMKRRLFNRKTNA